MMLIVEIDRLVIDLLAGVIVTTAKRSPTGPFFEFS
jgi:hypothetical protein